MQGFDGNDWHWFQSSMKVSEKVKRFQLGVFIIMARFCYEKWLVSTMYTMNGICMMVSQ
jgi:hypothetical protein